MGPGGKGSGGHVDVARGAVWEVVVDVVFCRREVVVVFAAAVLIEVETRVEKTDALSVIVEFAAVVAVPFNPDVTVTFLAVVDKSDPLSVIVEFTAVVAVPFNPDVAVTFLAVVESGTVDEFLKSVVDTVVVEVFSGRVGVIVLVKYCTVVVVV